MTVHVLGIATAGLILVQYFLSSLPLRNFWVYYVVGLLSAVCLVVMQSVYAHHDFTEQGNSGEPLPRFALYEVPLLGSPDAGMVVEVLYDYQCSHCRDLHLLLSELADNPQAGVAFALCPTPLSPRCNHYLPNDHDLFNGSCELASMALAIWYSDREKFRLFDQWLFSSSQGQEWSPREVLEARQYAATLLGGEENLANAMADPRIMETIDKTTQVFGRTSYGQHGGIPKLVYGQKWIIPDASGSAALLTIIQEQFSEK